MSTFSEELAGALAEARAIISGETAAKKKEEVVKAKPFFREWLRRRGTCYFFLFKKNLKVTNIQFADLLALMRSHFKADGSEPPTDLSHNLHGLQCAPIESPEVMLNSFLSASSSRLDPC